MSDDQIIEDEEDDGEVGTEHASPFQTVQVTVPVEDIHNATVVLWKAVENANMDPQVAGVALVLLAGLMTSPTTMSVEEEVAFIRAMMEFIVMWFGGGSSKAN